MLSPMGGGRAGLGAAGEPRTRVGRPGRVQCGQRHRHLRSRTLDGAPWIRAAGEAEGPRDPPLPHPGVFSGLATCPEAPAYVRPPPPTPMTAAGPGGQGPAQADPSPVQEATVPSGFARSPRERACGGGGQEQRASPGPDRDTAPSVPWGTPPLLGRAGLEPGLRVRHVRVRCVSCLGPGRVRRGDRALRSEVAGGSTGRGSLGDSRGGAGPPVACRP